MTEDVNTAETAGSTYQITYWRDLPSMVAAKNDTGEAKVLLAARFAEAIDEAAMRLGDASADDYLAGWRRGEQLTAAGEPGPVAEAVAAELDEAWPAGTIAAYLDGLGPAAGTRE